VKREPAAASAAASANVASATAVPAAAGWAGVRIVVVSAGNGYSGSV